MKKRLRKKKHLGEFTEYGVPIAMRLSDDIDFDNFLDSFLDAIEATGCYFGGGGKKDRFSGIIELGRESNSPEEKLHEISNWIKKNRSIEKYAIGKIIDLWYGSFDEIDTIEEEI